jgi:hypothetical protein
LLLAPSVAKHPERAAQAWIGITDAVPSATLQGCSAMNGGGSKNVPDASFTPDLARLDEMVRSLLVKP